MKALVVDDSRAIRVILTQMLKALGYQPAEARHGREAYLYLQANPDTTLALIDWNMPEMNGLQLLQELKKQGSAIKFGFVTSEGSAEMRQQATENGALFLVSKPFTVEAFQTALDGVIS